MEKRSGSTTVSDRTPGICTHWGRSRIHAERWGSTPVCSSKSFLRSKGTGEVKEHDSHGASGPVQVGKASLQQVDEPDGGLLGEQKRVQR